MQGKERNNIDEQFVSHAWNEMREMLDREMPVEGAERPMHKQGTWLLLLLLLIGFGAGSGLMYWYYNSSPVLLEKPVVNNLQANIPVTTDLEAKVNVKALNDLPETSKHTINVNRPVIAGKHTFSDIGPVHIVTPLSSITSVNLNTSALEEVHTSLFETKDELDLLSDNNHSKEYLVISETITAKTQNLSPLKDRALMPLSAPKELQPELNLLFPAKERWTFGVFSALTSSNINASPGWAAGLNVEYTLNKDFSLQSGIQFLNLVKRSPSESSLEVNSTQPEELVDASVSGVRIPQFLENVNYSRVPVDKLNYVVIPLSLNYQMSRVIGISAGTYAGYYLSGFESVEPNGSEGFTRNAIKDFDFGFQLGLGFEVMPGLTTSVAYNFGLSDFSSNDVFGFRERHTNDFFSLGLSYQFKK